MNIEVKVDEVTLATVVADVIGWDDDSGQPYQQGEHTIADLVAAQIVQQLRRDDGWNDLARQFRDIRTELIRDMIRPQLEEAIARPIVKTNSYGEPTGEATTLTVLIMDEARKALTAPVDTYNRDRGTLLTSTVAAEVKKALGAEIADLVKQARQQVSAEIGQHVAAAVQAGLKAR